MESVDERTGEVTEAAIVVTVEPSPFDGERSALELTLACERVLAGLRDESRALETLPQDVHKVETMAKALYKFWKSCEAAVIGRMVARNATLIGDPKKGPALALKQEHEYSYDEKVLRGLLDLVGQPDGLTAEEFEQAMAYKFAPSKSALNALAKRGGKVAEIINLGVRGTTNPKLELKGGSRR